MLGVGCGVLGVGCWVSGVGCRLSSVERGVWSVGGWGVGAWCVTPEINPTLKGIAAPTNVQHPTPAYTLHPTRWLDSFGESKKRTPKHAMRRPSPLPAAPAQPGNLPVARASYFLCPAVTECDNLTDLTFLFTPPLRFASVLLADVCIVAGEASWNLP